MNKSVVIVVVVLLALLGIGSFVMFSNKNQSSLNTSNEKNSQAQTQTKANKSFRDLMAMTTSQTCTYTDDQQNTGTVYVGGGKFRTDSTMTVNGQVSTTHMVSDSTNIYVWLDGATEGFKMPLPATESQPIDTTPQNVDINKQLGVDCQPWNYDSSKFALPDLKFSDFGSMMQQLVPTSQNSQNETDSSDSDSNPCAACNSLTGESATQCKKALNCN